ncbi:hypothetical protein [Rhodococcus sp. B10]|uniref:hypothetical protein n=1 Tax=Rhodococcus sp. B10 TaxID=2695876 RepID=UPI00142FEEE9|nr:hypothetical protein [Rhodococcus sp. B10]NIL76791.1 hypothetical protein [Rhodococcus sp. B10]
MNITQAAAEITTALEGAGLRVQGWEQKQVVGPVAIVVPADPFITDDGPTTMGEPFVIHYGVQLIAGRGTGDVMRAKVEQMVTDSVLALRAYNWSIDEVQYPLIGTENDNPTIGAQIALSAAINLKEDV